MDVDRPPGDERPPRGATGGRPPGGRSTNDGPPPAGRSTNDGPPPGHRTTDDPPADGTPKGAPGGGPPPADLSPMVVTGWTYLRVLYKMTGGEELVSGVCNRMFSPGRKQTAGPDGLPGNFSYRFSYYCDTVHALPKTRCEEIELQGHLESVLKQVQCSVKAMGMQPIELSDVHIVRSSPIRRDSVSGGQAMSYKAFVLRPRRKGFVLSPPRMNQHSRARNFEAELKKKKYQNQKLLSAYAKFSIQFKLSLLSARDNNDITPEFAQQLESLVECFDQNVALATQSGGGWLSLDGLLRMLKFPDTSTDLFDNLKLYGSLASLIVTATGYGLQCIGSSPIQFSAIGKKAKEILDLDFSSDKLWLTSDPCKNVSFGVGGQVGGGQTIGELMAKCKNNDNSFSFILKSGTDDISPGGAGVNAPVVQDSDLLTTKVSFDQIGGVNKKCVLKAAFPSLSGKFVVRRAIPYAVCAAEIELIRGPGGQVPVVDISAVGGVKYFGIGGQFQFKEGQVSAGVGMSFTTDLLALGLTCKQPGICKGTFCKEIVKIGTTIAAEATYAPQPVRNADRLVDCVRPGFQFSVGLKKALNQTLFFKAKIATHGASAMINKNTSDGKLSIRSALDVDFEHPWRVPKIGAVCSYNF